ncbi:MAG: hypothetical protein ABJC04_06930 [Verrucomicrobiota bacterium]
MKKLFLFCAIHLGLGAAVLKAADFSVTTPEDVFEYYVNGVAHNPTITLTRGQTYTFAIDTAAFHPFVISTPDFNFDIPGVSNNNINNGTITYVVPLDAPASLQYYCSFHFFGGTINFVDPPPPPLVSFKIISLSLTSSNVVLKSTGTNGFAAFPEFSSNLFVGNWTTVPSFTNVFAGGTNTSTFGRLEVICGPNVFLRVRNSPSP